MAKKNDNDNLIKNPDILYKYSVDILVVTAALLIAGFYLNGLNALKLAFVSVLSSVLCEDIGCRIMKRTDKKANNLYAAVTGLSVALMLPGSCPAYIAVLASLFAVLVVLIPFGTARKMPFVPAAAGICFVTVCFPQAVFAYAPITVGHSSPVFGSEAFIAGESFAGMLTYGKSVILNTLETISVLVGKTPGPMGTTCMLALIGAAVYLLLKRKEYFVISASFFASCALFAALFPRVNSGIYTSIVMELSAGTLVFAGLVLLTDPFTSPKTLPGRIAYGITAGVICMLLRRHGAYEEGMCFAVLIVNAVAPAVGDYFVLFTEMLRDKGIVIREKTTKFSGDGENEKKVRKEKVKKEKVKKEKNKKEKDGKTEKNRESDILSYDDIMKFDDEEKSEEGENENG